MTACSHHVLSSHPGGASLRVKYIKSSKMDIKFNRNTSGNFCSLCKKQVKVTEYICIFLCPTAAPLTGR